MNPDWQSPDGRISLYCNDCLTVLPHVKCDAVITDPPYGIGYKASQKNAIDYGLIHGDDKPFNPLPLLKWRNAVLWGANNYCNLLPIAGWICWDKRVSQAADACPGSPFELAWVSPRKPNVFKIIRVQHCGAKNADAPNGDVANQPRYHPTQKPIVVMIGCMDVAKVPPGATVFDPYMGSGTTGIACLRTGRKFIGVEIDEHYFQVAVERIKRELAQPFIPGMEPARQEQGGLGL
jgi:site-specific DNA-methyltransferase (adenine-specific)